MKKQPLSKAKQTLPLFPIVLLAITLFSGILLAGFLERTGVTFLRLQSESTLAAMSAGIRNDLEQVKAAGGAMAGSPWILPALADPSPANLENANSVLDRYNKNLGFSICYLMDLHGNVVASSNRNTPDNFIGKNYAFRPYFQEAVRGLPFLYMATGITSGEQGFYAAHPVKDKEGKIAGVSVIKKNIESAKGVLGGYENSFFVSPEGIIFISGSSDKILRPLWPPNDEQMRRIKDSRQFKLVSTEPVLSNSVRDGQTLRLGEAFYQFIQRPLGPQGWSLVLLAPLKSVFYYKFLGWVIAGFMSVITIFLILWAFLRMKAREALHESEERFSLAFKASGIGMAIVGLEGRWLQANPALCRMIGYSEKELLQKTFQEIFYSEDLEKSLSYIKRLLEGDILDYRVEKRYVHKDGHILWVLLSVALVRDKEGAALYFIAQIEDITPRKLIEEKLQDKVRELEKFNKIAIDRELRMIELKEKLKALEKGKENG